MKRTVLVLVALLAPALLAETIRCESDDGRRRQCHFGYGEVRLERQLSRRECVEGSTWGVRGEHIWVDDGCRADFHVSHRDRDRADGDRDRNRRRREETIVCESDNSNRHFCSADTSHGVRLVRQLSRSACVQGRSWGFTDRGIWVRDGCRAEFVVERW